MKILFIKDVKGTAKRGEVKEVAEGHAVNYLLPQKLAVMALPENLAKIKKELVKKAVAKETVINQSHELADKLRGKKIEIKAKANKEGKLYAAVSESEIKAAIKKYGLDIGEAKIIGTHDLKEAGEHEVKVDFGHSINSNIKVAVKV